MGGVLSAIPASFLSPSVLQEMPPSLSQLLARNDLKNMQEEELKELFRNDLDTLPVGDLITSGRRLEESGYIFC